MQVKALKNCAVDVADLSDAAWDQLHALPVGGDGNADADAAEGAGRAGDSSSTGASTMHDASFTELQKTMQSLKQSPVPVPVPVAEPNTTDASVDPKRSAGVARAAHAEPLKDAPPEPAMKDEFFYTVAQPKKVLRKRAKSKAKPTAKGMSASKVAGDAAVPAGNGGAGDGGAGAGDGNADSAELAKKKKKKKRKPKAAVEPCTSVGTAAGDAASTPSVAATAVTAAMSTAGNPNTAAAAASTRKVPVPADTKAANARPRTTRSAGPDNGTPFAAPSLFGFDRKGESALESLATSLFAALGARESATALPETQEPRAAQARLEDPAIVCVGTVRDLPRAAPHTASGADGAEAQHAPPPVDTLPACVQNLFNTAAQARAQADTARLPHAPQQAAPVSPELQSGAELAATGTAAQLFLLNRWNTCLASPKWQQHKVESDPVSRSAGRRGPPGLGSRGTRAHTDNG